MNEQVLQSKKREQRKLAFAARNSLSSKRIIEDSNEICEKLSRLEAIKNAKTVFSYCAVDSEVWLEKLHETMRSEGKILAFPVCHGKGVMDAVKETDCWGTDKYGIPMPLGGEAIEPEEIDVVLIPCVAFDEQRQRLGHGAGYYDRYLMKCTKAARIIVAFEAQKVEKVITEDTDLCGEMVVTEKMIYE